MNKFSNFNDFAAFIASETDNDRLDHNEMANLHIVEEPNARHMPEPDEARRAVTMVMQTIFDVLRDTDMEPYAADLAWGFANSFHVVSKRIEGREDDAAKKLGELARAFDPSEIYAVELEETQLQCQNLQECREVMESMRDHAGEVYRVETGRPFSPTRGSRVSASLTASMIDARDYLASRSRERREQYAPQGPIVVFSGGTAWEDHDRLWKGLDRIKARVPEMILATTAQTKGCDAIAQAWAAARGVKLIQFRLDRSLGNRAAFVRNDRMIALKSVEAIVCEGSGIQAHLAQKLRAAGVPLHVVKNAPVPANQRTARRA